MAKGWAGAAGLWRKLFFPCLICYLVPSESFQPNCTTDFATELVCRWNVDAATNCSRDVRLLYTQETPPHRNDVLLQSVCVPENERGSDLIPQCTCNIPVKEFKRIRFSMALEVNGTKTGSVDPVYVENHVKPRPLVNLTVDTKTSHLVVLTWKWNAVYTQENELRLHLLTYEVAYWPEGQRDKGNTAETEKQSFEIFAQQLSPGPYVASVRFKFLNFGQIWSEWSNPCKFHIGGKCPSSLSFSNGPNADESGNKFWSSAGKLEELLVLWLCAFVMAVILTLYLCFARLKRSWWDRIPNPAKSKVIEDMTGKPLSAVKNIYAMREGKAPLCDRHERGYENFPGSLSAALPGPTTSEKILWNGTGARREAFLTPKVTLVESPLMICSRVSADETEGPEREVLADAVLHEDAMASLFMKILDCDFSIAKDTESLEQSPAMDQASDRLLSTLCFLPENSLSSRTGKEILEGSAKCGYQSSIIEATSPWVVSPALEQQRALTSPVFSLPQSPDAIGTTNNNNQGDGSTLMTQLSGYRCLGSLLSQPMASSSQGWEPQLFPPEADQSQPHASGSGCCSLEPAFPGSSLWHSSCEAVTVLDFQLQQKASPEATYQNVPGKPGAVSCPAASLLSGYQSFNSALHNGTPDAQHDHSCLGPVPPYKTFLSVLRNSHPEIPLGRVLEPLPGFKKPSGETWLSACWDEDPDLRTLSISVHEDSSKDFLREEKGNMGRARGLLCP